MREPTLREPLLGWRVWRVSAGFIEAVVWSTAWQPRTRFEARCEVEPSPFWQPRVARASHRAPSPECECGVYAFKAREDAELLAREKACHDQLALGRVSLWGRVIETEYGFRAAYAYPYELELLGGSERDARALRNAYAVDVSCAAAPVPLHSGSG